MPALKKKVSAHPQALRLSTKMGQLHKVQAAAGGCEVVAIQPSIKSIAKRAARPLTAKTGSAQNVEPPHDRYRVVTAEVASPRRAAGRPNFRALSTNA